MWAGRDGVGAQGCWCVGVLKAAADCWLVAFSTEPPAVYQVKLCLALRCCPLLEDKSQHLALGSPVLYVVSGTWLVTEEADLHTCPCAEDAVDFPVLWVCVRWKSHPLVSYSG